MSVYIRYIAVRQELEYILGKEYRYLAIETRDRLKLTQKEMSERLYMNEEAYSDIETGKTICVGTLTATLLLRMQEDPDIFLKRVDDRIAAYREAEMAPV